MVDLSKLQLSEKQTRERKEVEPLSEDHDLVQALQAAHDAERRVSYRAFAVLAYACDEAKGPKFNPVMFGLLNRLPNGLDAIVCKSDGTQPNSAHADHVAQTESWDVIDSEEELKTIVG